MASNQFPLSLTPAQSPRTFGPVNVPDNLTKVVVRIPTWPQADRFLQAEIDVSYDGGANWQDLVTQNPWPGGTTTVGKDGTTDSSVSVNMQPGTNRQLRASVSAIGGQVSTLITITTS
jgi:hypothetical protein